MAGIGPSSAQPDGEASRTHCRSSNRSRRGRKTRVSFSAIVAAAGSRVHGLALLVFVLPEVPPLPLPSASTILAIPLIIISEHLVLLGEGSLLPVRLQGASIPRSILVAAVRYLAPVLRWIERASRPALAVARA